ncbi:hypothetical protein FSY59_03120 [Comamonas sp. Z3]|nr:hypothetical protein FSY59_03120 [Comamonas sp. Z3]
MPLPRRDDKTSPALSSISLQLPPDFYAKEIQCIRHLLPKKTKLLVAAQWALIGFSIFCLIGAAVVMALTVDAWPM